MNHMHGITITIGIQFVDIVWFFHGAVQDKTDSALLGFQNGIEQMKWRNTDSSPAPPQVSRVMVSGFQAAYMAVPQCLNIIATLKHTEKFEMER